MWVPNLRNLSRQAYCFNRTELSWADNLWSLVHASSQTTKGNNSPSPVLHDHFRTAQHSLRRSTAACVRIDATYIFSSLLGFLPARITQSPVLLLPPPPVLHCTSNSEKLWIQKDSQHSRILLLIQHMHIFLSGRVADLHFLENNREAKEGFSLQTNAISETWRAFKRLTPTFAIHSRSRNIKDTTRTTYIRNVASI